MSSVKVPLEVAYAEACQALGETVVRERLIRQELDKKLWEEEQREPKPEDQPSERPEGDIDDQDHKQRGLPHNI